MKKGNYTIHMLSCPGCNNSFPIPRKRSELRGRGHVKDIWCPFCNKTQKFVEGD